MLCLYIWHLELHRTVTNDMASAGEERIFPLLRIQCTVQMEVIQSVDNVVFFPATSRKEEQELLQGIVAKNNANIYPPPEDDLGMFKWVKIKYYN